MRRVKVLVVCLFVTFTFPPSARSDDRTESQAVDCTTLTGKVMVGYQGWFNCKGDGSGLGWKHWARRGARLNPNNVTFDLWPDMSELEEDEQFETDFRMPDGSPAQLFSSANQKTVLRHFRWMQEYGIDGAFVQRFASQLSHPLKRSNVDTVLAHARLGAHQSGRAIAVMYDLSGLKSGQVRTVREDWTRLVTEGQIIKDAAYLHHKGRPLVAVWGIGFSDNRNYTIQECLDLVRWLKSQNCSVMLGVPSFWREGIRDAVSDPLLKDMIRLADVISPWTVGRYRTPAEADRHSRTVWAPDFQWCRDNQIDFLPVLYPGFSWHNLAGGPLDQIPRLKGEFFWSQVTAAHRTGCDMFYVAMFDEVDEATAIFKCTNTPPQNDGAQFLTWEGLPSDHYLRLTGQAASLLRGKVASGSVDNPAQSDGK